MPTPVINHLPLYLYTSDFCNFFVKWYALTRSCFQILSKIILSVCIVVLIFDGVNCYSISKNHIWQDLTSVTSVWLKVSTCWTFKILMGKTKEKVHFPMGKLLSRFKYLYNLKIINSHSICFKKKIRLFIEKQKE